MLPEKVEECAARGRDVFTEETKLVPLPVIRKLEEYSCPLAATTPGPKTAFKEPFFMSKESQKILRVSVFCKVVVSALSRRFLKRS